MPQKIKSLSKFGEKKILNEKTYKRYYNIKKYQIIKNSTKKLKKEPKIVTKNTNW